MPAYEIGVIPGDGIGPEVVAEGLRVLEAAAKLNGFDYQLKHYPYGADHYLNTGEVLSEAALEEFRALDALYMGAIGDPRVAPGILERGIILTIRYDLDLYINLRPIVLYAEHLCPLKDKGPEDVNLVVVRENTECAYVGMGGFLKKGTPDEVAVAEMVYTRKGVERVVRYAFELARARGQKRKVTLVDKVNVIQAHELWQRTFAQVRAEYPDIEADHAFVDAAAMWLVKNPEWFDVMVTTNLFGDILTDLGAIIQGGMGIAASGNLHPGRVSMFEPIHGSAPKYTGRGVANPLAAIGAVAMMLDYLGEKKAATQIQNAIQRLLVSRRVPSVGTDSGLSTRQIGQMVLEALTEEGK